MNEPNKAETTVLLRAWAAGDRQALDDLTPRVYRELRRLAAKFLQNERQGHTLQSCELVNEVYLRLVDIESMEWQDRAHFFAISATLMRRILLDRARKRLTDKRGGKTPQLDLDAGMDVSSAKARELIVLDDALDALAQVDPRKAKIVELRFFAGLSVEETAEVVQVSRETVLRDWKLAKAWLQAELKSAS